MTETLEERKQFSVPLGPNPWLIAPHKRASRVYEIYLDREMGVYLGYDDQGALFTILDTSANEVPKPPSYGPVCPFHIYFHNDADRHETKTTKKVYFIGAGDGPIKIGYSVDLKARLSAIQSSSPVVLKILAWRRGGPLREMAYHAQFSEHRLHGEWFKPAPAILSEIERLKEDMQ